MPMKNGYVICINLPNDKAVGHSESCGSVRQMGSGTRATGTWLGPLDSRDKAESAAKQSAILCGLLRRIGIVWELTLFHKPSFQQFRSAGWIRLRQRQTCRSTSIFTARSQSCNFPAEFSRSRPPPRMQRYVHLSDSDVRAGMEKAHMRAQIEHSGVNRANRSSP
jgi:hypothetical protein